MTISAAPSGTESQVKTEPCFPDFFLQKLFPYTLIQYDLERDEPVRDVNGLCIESPRGKEMFVLNIVLFLCSALLFSHINCLPCM